MLLFYIDESGTGLKDDQTPYFVLTAVAIPAKSWVRIDNQVAKLKRRLIPWAKPEDFEIKGRDIRRGEKFFKHQNWDQRVNAMLEIADLLAQLPDQIITVQVDKRLLPDYVNSDNDLYRLAFWRLLDVLDEKLNQQDQPGMLMVDMRSDMHSSVQDRRLIDVYRDWVASGTASTRLIEIPWFGFSAFYAGLQLADFAAYVIDHVYNEKAQGKRNDVLKDTFTEFKGKVKLIQIP